MSVKEPVTSIYALKIAWYKLPLFRTGFHFSNPMLNDYCSNNSSRASRDRISRFANQLERQGNTVTLADTSASLLYKQPLFVVGTSISVRQATSVLLQETRHAAPVALKLYLRFLLSLLKHQTDTDTDPMIISSAPAIFKILVVDPSLRHAKLYSHVLTRYWDSFYLLAF